ncbi:MAG TPA: UDP-N-acetylmuramoyl-L-alanyl-D-glutamate--2,6-diaminopimelate ligase [Eggerthellaceae bacterium]|nr:UDP-N-acetylmuramoyl-L-alanyl-D-glutamate--2,6-diaminopimelate ligase [Eggerthellaceae bacterium]
MTSCADLFEGLDCTIIGNANEEVGGLAYRSDAVKPGDLFFCIVGLKVDGHSFAQDAIDRGARFVVVERKLYLAETDDVTLVVVKDSRKAMAHAAARFYGMPSQGFALVGVTGTNGKTTTTYLVEQIARVAGKRTGVIGTVGVEIAGAREKAEHTTPESPDLQRTLARMRDAQVDVVAMEVSSHALDLQRTWSTSFAVTAFSNLTQDHLDYHHTFEAYFEAKALLFSRDYPAKRVICIDDKWGRELLHRCSAADDWVITTGFDASAQIHPVSVQYFTDHTVLQLDVRGRRKEFEYPLVGRFNVENVMCAYGIGMALGVPQETIMEALAQAPQVPGRLERVKAAADGGVSVFVDYAHTPDALRKAVSSIKALTEGRTLVVFGCGGDRDRGKRPEMGRAAAFADRVIVTSDNPRGEDPEAIIAQVTAGIPENKELTVQPDRARAIAAAVEAAAPGDAVLIAGKGHEEYQIVSGGKIPFSDEAVVRTLLAERQSERIGN